MTGTTPAIPVWLVAVVVVLLAAVMIAAVAIVQELQARPRHSSVAEMEVARLEQAVKGDAADHATRLELAVAYHQVDRFDEAFDVYQSVLADEPGNEAALYGAGLIHLERGDVEEGERLLLAVLEHEPGHAHAATLLGTLYAEQERYVELLAVVEPAAERSIGIVELCFLMGLAHENLGDTERAAECFMSALGYVPDMEESRAALVRMGLDY